MRTREIERQPSGITKYVVHASFNQYPSIIRANAQRQILSFGAVSICVSSTIVIPSSLET